MTDETYFRALIASNRDADRAAAEEAKRFDTWTEADVAKMLDPHNPEVNRLVRGENTTRSAAESAEVERLAKIAAEESRR